MYTLTDFIINELEKYNLPVTKKNLAKLRNKYTRELKKENLWETAETKLIGRAQTKIFKEKDLTKIAKKFISYMKKQVVKQSPYNKHEIEKFSKEIQSNIDDNEQEFLKKLSNQQPKFETTKKQKKEALNNLMLEAIFNHFFKMSPQQKKTFEKDISAQNLDPELHTKDPQYLISMKRLQNKHKLGTYYNLRSETKEKH